MIPWVFWNLAFLMEHYGNMALETVLFAELFFNLAGKWGVSVCSDASLTSAYYLTERPGSRHVRNVTENKACWVRALCDISEPILKFPMVGLQLLRVCDAINTLKCEKKKDKYCTNEIIFF